MPVPETSAPASAAASMDRIVDSLKSLYAATKATSIARKTRDDSTVCVTTTYSLTKSAFRGNCLSVQNAPIETDWLRTLKR